jgi:hypothetical protein
MFISDKIKLQTIQEEFSKQFPFLKLEFYSGSHDANEGSMEADHLDAEKTIGEVRTIHNKGEIELNEEMAVADLEKDFFEKYGLNVQVFRKSKDLWLQTTKTDRWTLAEQNQRGAEENTFGVS